MMFIIKRLSILSWSRTCLATCLAAQSLLRSHDGSAICGLLLAAHLGRWSLNPVVTDKHQIHQSDCVRAAHTWLRYLSGREGLSDQILHSAVRTMKGCQSSSGSARGSATVSLGMIWLQGCACHLVYLAAEHLTVAQSLPGLCLVVWMHGVCLNNAVA